MFYNKETMFCLSHRIPLCGLFAVDKSELSNNRKKLDEKLKKLSQSSTFEQITQDEDYIIAETSAEDFENHSVSSKNNQFWYERDPELFQAEKDGMTKFFPHFQLDKLDDGRLYWVGDLTSACGSKNDGVWTVMAVYDNDHPNSCGTSVKIYPINPDINELSSTVGVEEKGLPHTSQDCTGTFYILTPRTKNADTGDVIISSATSLMFANKWAVAVSLWLKGNIDDKIYDYDFFNDELKNETEVIKSEIKSEIAKISNPKHIIFSNRAFAALLAETKEKITTETGGIFLGIMCDDIWHIMETIDPGPKSIFQTAYFEYDGDYVRHLANKVNRLYGDRLDVLGLWHRHPGSMDTFSNTDYVTIQKFAEQNNGITISALVNIDPYFRLTMYAAVLHDSLVCKKITYEVDDSKIPHGIINVLHHKDIEEKINSMSTNPKPHRKIFKNDFLIEYLKKAENCKIIYGVEIENTDEERNFLIENYLVDECLFCEEMDIPFIYDSTEDNRIDFIIGDESPNLTLSFCVFDFSRKENFIFKKSMLKKMFFPDSEIEKKNEKHPCFIYNGKLYLYEGNLIKNAWEASKK